MLSTAHTLGNWAESLWVDKNESLSSRFTAGEEQWGRMMGFMKPTLLLEHC